MGGAQPGRDGKRAHATRLEARVAELNVFKSEHSDCHVGNNVGLEGWVNDLGFVWPPLRERAQRAGAAVEILE